MKFPIYWHRSRSARILGTSARYAVEALERRTLLNSYLVTNVFNSGTGSLRDAITQANNNPGLDVINFGISGGGVQVIKPTFFLPQITDPVEIHGESQPGYAGIPLIELDGSQAGSSNGLEFKVGGNVVEGLDIHSFALDGIVFAEPTGPNPTGGDSVLKNFIGTDPTGLVAMGNQSGIHLIYSPHDLIQSNLISGNVQSGVFVADQFSTGTHIEGNLIGTDITGLSPLGNRVNGVALGAPPTPTPGDGFASGNFVGGAAAAQRNVISGNGLSGVWIKGGTGNTVQGNYIGVGVDGTTPVGNGITGSASLAQFGTDGILIDGASNNVIGGATTGAGNLISANSSDGVQITDGATGNTLLGNFVGTKALGLAPLPNGRDGASVFDSTGNTIGGQLAGSLNVISGNKVDGVYLGATTSGGGAVANQVLGNYIGVDITGLTALANQKNGVEVSGGTNNIIGGVTSLARNTISGNLGSGVLIGGFNSIGTQVLGNFIGTNAIGLLAIPNTLGGVSIFDAPLSVIGGTTAAARNVISGNGLDGVTISDGHAVGNVIEGNYIGTDISGKTAIGNTQNGVVITALSGGAAATGNVIGGSVAGAGNVISGNGDDGIQISTGSSGNSVLGNLIGTSFTGLAALANGLNGVELFGASTNTIGGTPTAAAPTPGNVISANANDGVQISSGSSGNTLVGNLIGTTSAGDKPLANGRHGVAIFDSNNNTVGGAATPAGSPPGNVISGNVGSGVAISGAATGTATGNTVLGNLIGLNQLGTQAVPNQQDGVLVQSAAGNNIGTSVTGGGNVISGNGSAGVAISGMGAANDSVSNNYIGTDVTGTSAVPNALAGVFINNVPNNTIGGTPASRNVISGNNGTGVDISGSNASGNMVYSNFIGTDTTGTKVVANQGNGVLIDGAAANFIGNKAANQGNVISGNVGDGIAISGATATNNQIQQNLIGTDPSESLKLGNQKYGIEASGNANNNVIGAPLTGTPLVGQANTVAYNGASLGGAKGYGVVVPFGASDSIRANSIYDNGGRGIVLVNLGNPFPFIVPGSPIVTAVKASGANTDIFWKFKGNPSTTYTIDFYSNIAPSPSGFGDGHTFVTTETITTDANGNKIFDGIFHPDEQFISATATDSVGNTSEFSMVDTDADGLANAWETNGIDYNEDGTIDFTLPGANPNRKDVYVQIDSMASFEPTTNALNMVIKAFANAPVANPDGSTGISLHLESGATMADQQWIGDLNGDGVINAFDLNPFNWLAPIKAHGINGVGGFGTPAEQANPLALAAKALVYRYALFADQFQIVGADGNVNYTTSGIAEIGGNDLIVALGGWGQNADTDENEAGTFMHELGHTLGLHHGGNDDINFKPNYQSVMNYEWQVPAAWMYEDPNQNGVKDAGETDINGNGTFGDTTWSLNYSTATLASLNENTLVESAGIGGIPGNWELVGPSGTRILTSGAVDWNGNKVIDANTVTSSIDLNNDGTLSTITGYNDWANLQYYFADSPDAANGAVAAPDDNELTLAQWEADNAQGPGPGVLEFQSTVVNSSENDTQAVITVLRGAGTTGTVSVDYSTSDGTAIAGSDYTATSGTLTFAPGQYLQTITVPILNDGRAGNATSFILNLSNPTGGAELREDEKSATVTIANTNTAKTLVVTNTNDSGPGSLRQAILDSNANPGFFLGNLINFDIGGGGVQTIKPLSPLPTITTAVAIDATTQPGFTGTPIIEIDGEFEPPATSVIPAANGLTIDAPYTTVRGLVINRFQGAGIQDGGYQGGSVPSNYPHIYFDAIVGNYIGTDVSGLVAKPNGEGLVLGGIGGGYFTIGGTTAANRNVISGNSDNGILISKGSNFYIQGNYIGVGADGTTALGNGTDGVLISNNDYLSFTASDINIGGLDADQGNIIAYNTVGVFNYLPQVDLNGIANGTSILSNSIYSNKVTGIQYYVLSEFNNTDLSGGSLHYPQNTPILNSAISSGGVTTITGYIKDNPNQTYTIQLFSNVGIAYDGVEAQGAQYLGTTTVTTDDNGFATFTVTYDVSLPLHTLVTATATDVENQTSLFSPRLAVGDILGNTYVVNSNADDDEGWTDPAHLTLREAILAANNHPGLDTIDFAIGSGVQTIAPRTYLPDVEDPVTIDGTSQPGFSGTPVIVISGAAMVLQPSLSNTGGLQGLTLYTDDSTIRGLDINSFFYYFYVSNSSPVIQSGLPLVIFGNNNVIAGDFIGTDPTGTTDVPNLFAPLIEGNNNRIGGTTVADRNLLSGNAYGDLSVSGTGNVIEGNYVGTDVTGTRPLFSGFYPSTNISFRFVPFTGNGISVTGQATIGGSTPGAGNVIAGLLATYVTLFQSGGSVVQGNIIGLDATGTKSLFQFGSSDGIDVEQYSYSNTGDGVTIGGPLPGQGNIISGGSIGIDLGTDNNIVQGNYVGTDIAGLTALGNFNDGVRVDGNNNLVGGPNPGDGNVISGNRGMGVRIDGSNGTGNIVQGNKIGVGTDGVTPIGNVADGVGITSQSSNPTGNLIGGLASGDGNIIAYNRSGVDVNQGKQIAIYSNSIFNNTGLGIDLGLDGVTPNDPGDADTGNNNLQNYPVLTSVVTDGIHASISGTLNSTADTVFQLQFFVNDIADSSGFGEGKKLLGTRQVATDDTGNVSFTVTFAAALTPSQFISATATDPTGNTSEFSNDAQLASGTPTPNQPPTVIAGGPYTINEGDSLTLDASHTSDPDGDPLTYMWDINGDGVFGDATGVKPTLTWAQLNALGIVNGPSSFNVQVRVDDGQGHVVKSSSVKLTVLNVAPIANAGPDLNVNEEDTVNLTGTFTDPGTADTHTFNWHVVADNGQVIPDGSGSTFSFVPDDTGNYAVTFSVTDSDGATGTTVVNVYSNDVPPVGTINGLPTQGTVGVPINLTASATDISPIATAAGFQYFWQAFPENDDSVYFSASTQDFSFTPPEADTYDIYLNVYDKDFGSSQIFTALTVVGTTGTTPTVTVTDAGGVFTGAAFPATALVNGSASLEGISPTLTYYAGNTATGTPLGGAPSTVGTYTVIANFVGSTDYVSATSSPVSFSITPATPTATVSDAGGTHTGSTFPATAKVNGATSLEGISPTLTYYSGSAATGTPLGGAPSVAGTYTVVANFAGSADYAAAISSPVTFSVTPATPTVTV
ncbi:MAG TPA: Calx-beta domain-containing protein, partial [Tepidisphaeraceae bacterium]|nr:Calx-beta domain-containing protein [Tepidisphaeraceae bacterium]